MNNKIILSVVVVVILAASAVWFVGIKKNYGVGGFGVPNPPQETNIQDASRSADESANKPSDTTNDFNGTLTDLMAKATPSKCNAEFDMERKTQKQTIYFDGKNLRSEMVMDIGGIKNNVFVIVKDGWEYVWNENNAAGIEPMAMKLKFTAFDQQKNPEAPATQGGAMDASQKMKFSCAPWSVDAAMFELPAGVEFQDFTATVQKSLENSPQSICGACDLIPDASAKAECQKSNCQK